MFQVGEDDAARVLENSYGKNCRAVKQLLSGRVNKTFLVDTEGGERLILQSLSPFFGGSPALGLNPQAVWECLSQAGLKVPQIFPDLRGELVSLEGGSDQAWRLSSFLEGEPPPVGDRKAAKAAGRFLGASHSALNIPRPLELISLPAGEFTNQGLCRPEDFLSIKERYGRHPALGSLLGDIERGAKEAAYLPGRPSFQRVFLIRDLVIHGDPKASNFLFHPSWHLEEGKAHSQMALIDWDTVCYGDPLIDIGELCRSLAALPGSFDVPICREVLRGYKETGLELQMGHFDLLGAVIRGISLNLARRYLVDALAEIYFRWDKDNYPSLYEQNRQRGHRLLDLCHELMERDMEMHGLYGS
jgi:Ser/Thr protein kinase RdoA (MazF antagonist)